jgi:hypothetical protein
MAKRRTKDDEEGSRLEPAPAATAAAGEPTIVDAGGIKIPEILCRRTLGRFVWKRDRRRGWVVTEI